MYENIFSLSYLKIASTFLSFSLSKNSMLPVFASSEHLIRYDGMIERSERNRNKVCIWLDDKASILSHVQYI